MSVMFFTFIAGFGMAEALVNSRTRISGWEQYWLQALICLGGFGRIERLLVTSQIVQKGIGFGICIFWTLMTMVYYF